jgi:hypothetical protein
MDACAEFSDLAVGDPWIRGAHGDWKYGHPDGASLVLVHTELGEEVMRQAREGGALKGFPIPIEEAVDHGQHIMMREKKEQVGLRLRWRQKLGMPVPRYPGIQAPRATWASLVAELRFLATRLNPLCSLWQWLLLRFALSPVGLWLIRTRQATRKWRHRSKS